ncbi:hypothetical protein ES703_40329 [subsurface metagenome]
MTKWLATFITSLTVLVFIAGCPPLKPEPVKPPKAEQPKVESSKAEPDKVEPTKAEPNELEPTKTEPPKTEPPKTKPPKTKPPKTEPPKTEPPKTEPPKTKPPTKVTFHDKCAPILKAFAKLDPNEYNSYNSWPKEDKIAFWINAYNIKMLKIIVDNYPIQSSRILRLFWPPDSIRHIDKRIGGINKQKFIVMDEEFTLQAVEQWFFRKQSDEPRVFFAISGACLSSPPLRNEPYYGHKLYKQLDDQAKKFLAGPRAFKIDRGRKTVYLSAILQPTWYGKEFISKYGTDKKFKDQQPATRAVLNFLTNYISRQNVSFLEIENYSVKPIKYDWRLNDSSRR